MHLCKFYSIPIGFPIGNSIGFEQVHFLKEIYLFKSYRNCYRVWTSAFSPIGFLIGFPTVYPIGIPIENPIPIGLPIKKIL